MEIDPTKVVVPEEKLTGYLLSKTHPIGRYKSAFFFSLGYDAGQPGALAADLKGLLVASAEPGETSAFGQKVLASGPIHGPNGQIGRVRTVWIILSGDPWIRLVTAYPED